MIFSKLLKITIKLRILYLGTRRYGDAFAFQNFCFYRKSPTTHTVYMPFHYALRQEIS